MKCLCRSTTACSYLSHKDLAHRAVTHKVVIHKTVIRSATTHSAATRNIVTLFFLFCLFLPTKSICCTEVLLNGSFALCVVCCLACNDCAADTYRAETNATIKNFENQLHYELAPLLKKLFHNQQVLAHTLGLTFTRTTTMQQSQSSLPLLQSHRRPPELSENALFCPVLQAHLSPSPSRQTPSPISTMLQNSIMTPPETMRFP